MKKNIVKTASIFILTTLVLISGCAQHSGNLSGTDYYADDMYKMVPKAKHEKRFPHGHLKKSGNDPDKHCYYDEGTAAYFCQHWDPWDE